MFVSPLSNGATNKWVPNYLKKTNRPDQALRQKVKLKSSERVAQNIDIINEKKKPALHKPTIKRFNTKPAITKTNVDHGNMIMDHKDLVSEFRVENKSKEELKKLKEKVLKRGTEAVKTLVTVMKDEQFPIKNRWLATFMLARVMGRKSSPFISKFAEHPHWMLRMASLKSLMGLGEAKYEDIYASSLNDDSLVVRSQGLEIIRHFKLRSLAPSVWNMMYHRHNYTGGDGKKKRTYIIGQVIKTIGDLGYSKVKSSLFKMISKEKYSDVFKELDYALSKLTGKKSPDGPINVKKHFWNRTRLNEVKI